jgi:cell shape-determining protein MreC
MLIRICLIIAIIAALAAGVVNFVRVKEVITTTRNTLNTTSNVLLQTEGKLSSTEKKLKGTQAELKTTKETLIATEEERDTALAEAEKFRKSTADLTAKLKDTIKQRDDALADLGAWNALGIPVEGVKKIIAELKGANEAIEAQKEEIKILMTKNRSLENELAIYRDPEYRVKLPEGLKGKVIVSDPKWDFVVIDIGADHGILEQGELLVDRNGKLVAKVRVIQVEKDRCIANVVKGWRLGEVVEGDKVIPAF